MVGRLPHYYTDVPPFKTNKNNIIVSSVVSLTRDNLKEQADEEYMWLEHTRRVIEDNTGTGEHLVVSVLCLLPAAVSSNHQPYRPASTVPWHCPHSSYDPAFHGCGKECCRTCESWPDTCCHIGPATVCLGKADSMEVAREVW